MKDFEKRLKRLEEISGSIGNTEQGLEQSVKLFEEGIGLAKTLETDLETLERRVELLISGSGDQKPEFSLFPELDSQDQEEK
jgi:exodeoxyribonuclease VII small subunit